MEENKIRIQDFLGSKAGKFVMIIIFYIIIICIISVSVGVFDNSYFAIIISVVFAYFGWKSLSRITPNIFLIMPIGGWVIYYLVKGVLALFIGIFVAPFVLSKKISEKMQEKYR